MASDSQQKGNTTSSKPKVYYSTVPGWKPSNDKNAVVIYTTKSGKTTGETSMGSQSGLAGIDTNQVIQKRPSEGGGTQSIGSALASSVTVETTTSNIIPTGYQGVTTQQGVMIEKIPTTNNGSGSIPSILQQPKLNTTKDYKTFLGSQPISNSSVPSIANFQQSGTVSNMQQSLISPVPEKKQQSSINPFTPMEKYNLPVTQRIESGLESQWKQSTSKNNFLVQGAVFTGAFAYGFGKTAINLPGSILKDIYDFPSKPGEVIERNTVGMFKGIQSGIQTSPGETFGSLTAGLTFGKILKTGVYKASDISRTYGLKEISSSEVIAPEYPRQRYPQIARGQTAGELLKEFKDYGYTASPKPIKSNLGILKGSSELPGLYQSPKLSPTFLKLSGEGEKSFTINPFETLRPTASRVYPKEFELVPGVDKGSRVDSGRLPQVKEFFLTSAEKGKSYIPYIKTEKEAVIPFETKLTKLPSKEYFKFNNRRIPIEEFKTSDYVSKGKNIYQAKELSNRGSSYSLVSSAKYSPSDIPYIGNIKSSSNSQYNTSSYKTNLYSAPITTRSNMNQLSSTTLKSSVSYSKPSVSYSKPSISYMPSVPSRQSGLSYNNEYKTKSSYSIIPKSQSSYFSSGGSSVFGNYNSYNYKSYAPIKTSKQFVPNDFDIKQSTVKRNDYKKSLGNIAPSFTAEVFSLTGAFPKSGAFGISPFSIRTLPRGYKGLT